MSLPIVVLMGGSEPRFNDKHRFEKAATKTLPDNTQSNTNLVEQLKSNKIQTPGVSRDHLNTARIVKVDEQKNPNYKGFSMHNILKSQA
eukprot:scaffold21455_cov116-Cylindrotheca_fusiformis.AAC.7